MSAARHLVEWRRSADDVPLNDGGVFGATADWTGSAAMNLNSGTFTFSPADPGGIGHTITLSGALTGNGGLLVTNGGRLVLAGNNTYSGNTTVGMGALVLGNAGALPVGGALTLGGNGVAGTVDLAGFNPQLSSLATAGTAASQIITNSAIEHFHAYVQQQRSQFDIWRDHCRRQ